jgi:glucose-1-phosphate thymidylyltransferase
LANVLRIRSYDFWYSTCIIHRVYHWGARMKGVILAGGSGSRLKPLTEVTNKNLLPVYDRPMLFYPIEVMVAAGVTEILVVTGPERTGDLLRALGDGSRLGLQRLYFTVQEAPTGIAHAIGLAETFAGGDHLFVILGDNLVFGADVTGAVQRFHRQTFGAKVFLKAVPDPERFGVAEVRGGAVIGIEEKPCQPKSNLAVTGLYLYDHTVFDKIRHLRPSARGELEVTDLNRAYLREGTLHHDILSGDWIDAGTFESLFAASEMARRYAMRPYPMKDELAEAAA